jgi:serine/threonine protein kinase
MELVEGISFLEHVRGPGMWRGGLAPAAIDRLRAALLQLCDALEALHSAHIVHRDLKPRNILVTPDGRVVVLDFGLAAEVDCTGQHLSHQPRLLGTVGYMAPEQAACQAVSPASDWYSVGVMLFEALTGQLPFHGSTAEVVQAKQQHDAPDPASLVPSLPRDLALLCRDLLSRDPARRPGVAHVRQVLGQAEPGAAALPGDGTRLIGRREHLDTLAHAYQLVRHGQTTVVALHGPSGVGKSALVRHFLDDLGGQGEAVLLVGRCYEQESVP